MKWNKIHTIVATVGGIFVIGGSIFGVINYFTPKTAHEALASEVHEEYVKQKDFENDFVAMNQSVQQGQLDFWIYKTKQEILELQKEKRNTNDPDKKQEIQDQIDILKEDLKNYNKKLQELKIK